MTVHARGMGYCLGRTKRTFDVILAVAALIVLAPIFPILAAAVAITSGRPVLFRQDRVGIDGRPFNLIKFRTMRSGAGPGLSITGTGDPRITPLGRGLRALKLDELPQLLNVLRGEMSFVGPRPELPRYVARYDAQQRRVLAVRPGLTDPATIEFRDEETLLGAVDPERRETYYVSEILPRKLAMNLRYVDRASLGYDLVLLAGTLRAIVLPPRA